MRLVLSCGNIIGPRIAIGPASGIICVRNALMPSSTIELSEHIPVETPLGRGYAIMIEQCSHDVYWKVVLNDGGGVVDFTQDRIRVQSSYTHRRGISDQQMRKIVSRSRKA